MERLLYMNICLLLHASEHAQRTQLAINGCSLLVAETVPPTDWLNSGGGIQWAKCIVYCVHQQKKGRKYKFLADLPIEK